MNSEAVKTAALGLFAGLTLINLFSFVSRLFTMGVQEAITRSLLAYAVGLGLGLVVFVLIVAVLTIMRRNR
jgi:hypothetical protein